MFAQAKRFMKKIFVKGGHVPGRILKKSKNERERARAFRRVYFDGRMLGVHGKGCHIRKPCCVSLCDERTLTILAGYQCDHSTSMNLPRAARPRPSKQDSTQDSSHRL